MDTYIVDDFRIGNLMMDEISGEWLRVSALTETDVTTDVIDRSKYPLPDGWQMVPIPLTKEILAKYGFVQGDGYEMNEHFWAKKDGQLKVAINPDNGSVFITKYQWDIRVPLTIKWLHKLQNIYYAFTSEELTEKV